MVKTSSKKLRGIRGNVFKHVIRLGQNDATQHYSIIAKGFEKVGPFAKAHWGLILRTCTKWNLIPLEFDSVTGRAGLSALWKRCVHYLLVCLCAILMIYRVYGTIERVVAGNLDISTYICGGYVLISFGSSLAVVGTTFLSSPLCDLFKSWKSMEQISGFNFERSKTMFDDESTSTKVLLIATAVHLIPLNASMFSLTGKVPTCVLPTLTRMGWLELPDIVPRVMWSLAFLPLEVLTQWPPVLALGVCFITIALGLGTFKVFAEQVRKVKVDNMNDWMKVYRLRRVMQVYNVIFLDWATTMIVMGLNVMSCGVILLLYVTVRPSNIPWLIYIWFPIAAALIMVIITWIAYDCVIIKRSVADVDGNLQEGLDSWRLRDMKARRRTVYNRMLKSIRPASLILGPFGEITLDVPINAWDEVLNQLLFLLSL